MTCGDNGGLTVTGRPCLRAAGWGVVPDTIVGRCMTHIDLAAELPNGDPLDGTCGAYKGIAVSTGLPCKRAAGWGFPGESTGQCRTHRTIEPVLPSGITVSVASEILSGTTVRHTATVRDLAGNLLEEATLRWAFGSGVLGSGNPVEYEYPVSESTVSYMVVASATYGSVIETATGLVTIPGTVVEVTPPPPPPPEPETPPPPPAEGEGRIDIADPRVAALIGPQVADTPTTQSALLTWRDAEGRDWFNSIAHNRGLEYFAQFGASTDTYYDYPLTQYIQFLRTGDVDHLTAARTVADAAIAFLMPKGTGIAPRSLPGIGIMLRAIELETSDPAQATAIWEWLAKWARNHNNSWIARHYTRGSLWYGVRDGSFTLIYLAMLAQVHPDEVVRTEMTEHARRGSVDYYARLQKPDGGWYWIDPDASDATKARGAYGQPFHIGLTLEALTAVHKILPDGADRETTKQAFLKGTDWLYQYGFDTSWNTLQGQVFDAMFYYVWWNGGAGPTGTGNGETREIWDLRQRNSTCVHAWGYAYHLTGDVKYQTQGDRVFRATFDYDPANKRGSTGIPFYIAKTYSQCYRTGGQYLALRG